MVTTTKITTLTPETINTSTPTIDHTNTKILTNPYSYNKEIIHPEIYTKERKIVSQEKIEDTALKKKLAKLNFRDTGLATQHKTKKTELLLSPCTTKSDDSIPQTHLSKTTKTKM